MVSLRDSIGGCLFEARPDGYVADREGLADKPAPDMFLVGAKALEVEPARPRCSKMRRLR